jgi:hypothetical protein
MGPALDGGDDAFLLRRRHNKCRRNLSSASKFACFHDTQPGDARHCFPLQPVFSLGWRRVLPDSSSAADLLPARRPQIKETNNHG